MDLLDMPPGQQFLHPPLDFNNKMLYYYSHLIGEKKKIREIYLPKVTAPESERIGPTHDNR